ncbi:hypothetical protein BDN72DRAFT_847786 [Pluteus cervinus]|uniref:Uncharacterized protein n=1 Tax=Pluteus cervinus TaxID=181527 RepID=A0ACD3AD63_9AGAR|nr:hypothetical protein BDN72DRAFT_847786 [Pluteus cervinus]
MARIAAAESDNDSGAESRSTKKNKGSKAATREDVEDVEMKDNEGEEDEDEGEYEIEAIIDAKRGMFPEGRMGYLVKWKGYDEGDNSWVNEDDAGNAQVLIDDFWKNKTTKRKSMDAAKTPKRGRKSVATDDGVEVVEKKRGRKSQAKDQDNGEESMSHRAGKKAKNSEENGDEEIGSMAHHMDTANWESLVKRIDTVERGSDASLWVYFTLTTGERVKEKSNLCAERFPQKLIAFYEDNLRWRAVEEETPEEAV